MTTNMTELQAWKNRARIYQHRASDLERENRRLREQLENSQRKLAYVSGLVSTGDSGDNNG